MGRLIDADKLKEKFLKSWIDVEEWEDIDYEYVKDYFLEMIDSIPAEKTAGRKKYNKKWIEKVTNVVRMYFNGESIDNIAKYEGLSKRTVYRYIEAYKSDKAVRDRISIELFF